MHYLVNKCHEIGCDAIFANDGKIPSTAIDFAIQRCQDYIETCLHNDIDMEDGTQLWEHEWDIFLQQHYQLTHEQLQIEYINNTSTNLNEMLQNISRILAQIQDHWPQYSIDGYLNLWIIKPANKCRGRGIHLSNNLKKILNIINPSVAAKCHYIIQKYIGKNPL